MSKSNNKKKHKSLTGIIVCQGESEYIIAKCIRSNLRLSIEIYAKNKGRSSIQINSIFPNFLNKTPYKSKSDFINKFQKYFPEGEINEEFKIFIIMDTDDKELTSNDIENFKNKNMFKNHWAYKYIVPIYNTENLEDVLLKAGIIDETTANNKAYAKIFPINKNAGVENRKQIQEMYNKLKNINTTNMEILLEYLLELSK